jgi:hypothetical protein
LIREDDVHKRLRIMPARDNNVRSWSSFRDGDEPENNGEEVPEGSSVDGLYEWENKQERPNGVESVIESETG